MAPAASQGRRTSASSTTSRSQRDTLYHRIFHLSELLRVEKANQDENTSCYVELVSKADREKAPSIRQTFERINQRSFANIAQLEQRLQDCWLQLKNLEHRTATSQETTDSASSSQQQFFTPKGSFSRAASFSLPRIRIPRNSTVEEIHGPSAVQGEERGAPQEAPVQPFLGELAKLKLEELKSQVAELKEAQKALEEEWHNVERSWKDDKWEMMELLQEEKKRWAAAFLSHNPGSPSSGSELPCLMIPQ